jgi:hypothetical protein
MLSGARLGMGSHRVYVHSTKPGIVVVPGKLGRGFPFLGLTAQNECGPLAGARLGG